MKNSIIYFLVISFLLQSCYTYKAVDLKNTQLIVGENYKITYQETTETAKLMVVNDSVITVLVDNAEKDISVSNIREIKKRYSAVLSTFGLLIGVTLIVGGAVIVSDLKDQGYL